MKVLNYDSRTLIFQNLKPVKKERIPDAFTPCQYRILRSIIRRKHIKKEFFDFLLSELYDLTDWRRLSYWEMYGPIHILRFYSHEKGRI